jgi:hypothetical protein
MSRTSTSVHQPTQLTRDETRILEECDRESLIYRSLPLGILTFFAVQYAMTKNIISTKAKWFKLGAGLFAGYIIGKISYTPACRKKILTQLPNSGLAQMIHGVESPQINTPNEAANTYSTSGDSTYKTNK